MTLRQKYYPLKRIAFTVIFSCFIIFGCKKSPNVSPDTNNKPKLEGGKGGDFNVAFFSKADGKGVASRMFLKYAAQKMPADTALYDEKMNTMIEFGFGPHVHFEDLKKGTYFLFAKSASVHADTVFTLTDSTKKDQDIVIYLK